jgi:hypothetical protein
MDNTVVFWMLVFFTLFYIYFDKRINNLREELLIHYKILEDVLSEQGIGNGKRIERYTTNSSEFDIIPTFQETRNFVQRNSNCSNCNSCRGKDWYSNSINSEIKDIPYYADFDTMFSKVNF